MTRYTCVWLCTTVLFVFLASHPVACDVQSALKLARTDPAVYEQELLKFASFPSISALPEYSVHTLAAASWLKERLANASLQNVQILSTEAKQPVVYADWLHAEPGKPTVLVYGHYDVQPVDPLDLWHSDPFQPEVRDGYFYGRGVDDDKGGLLEPIQAIEAILRADGALPVNVKLMFEGQEEIGSPNLEAFLQAHADLLAADVALSADGRQIGERQPAIFTGLRGAVGVELEVVTARTDMHSGMKGGSVLNPIAALARLLDSMHHSNGSVAVEGFYEDVLPMTDEDKADVAANPFDAEGEQAELGVLGFGGGEEGYSVLEQRGYRPTLEFVGVTGGFTGTGIKTIVPARASAKIACRLVPNQKPDAVVEQLQRHVRTHQPALSNVTLRPLGFRGYPWVSPKGTKTNKAATKVLQLVTGVEPLFYREGGSVPALAYIQQLLKAEVTMFGFGLGENIHAPNERLKTTMYHRGRIAWLAIFYELGGVDTTPYFASERHDEL